MGRRRTRGTQRREKGGAVNREPSSRNACAGLRAPGGGFDASRELGLPIPAPSRLRVRSSQRAPGGGRNLGRLVRRMPQSRRGAPRRAAGSTATTARPGRLRYNRWKPGCRWVVYPEDDMRGAKTLIATYAAATVSYTHLRAHETVLDLVCRLLLEKKKRTKKEQKKNKKRTQVNCVT